ncbi:hypothetical protein [Verrucosispora sp. WMMC514]|uniref:hypothetical protein n=1 Tax=Verrucosispora sp. WMMC514 TaxID=3015156 RepID=UPI00248C0938|nr:hypothetical protein [Verrucosispora sp. WMMC514]WBB94233.1 hypothetical protein O7597_15390 [Verrucosispora sp. WMMC514]
MTRLAAPAIRPMLNVDSFSQPTGSARTNETLTALAAAQRLIAEHDLPVRDIDIAAAQPGAKQWNPDVEPGSGVNGWTLPSQPTIRVHLYVDLDGFYRWCTHLGADRIRVERHRFHTAMDIRVRAEGLTWYVTAHLGRPAKPHPHLPGIPAPWERAGGRLTDHGVISRDDLRTVLTTLGVL